MDFLIVSVFGARLQQALAVVTKTPEYATLFRSEIIATFFAVAQ
jgi:hypothetical protein